MDGRIVVFRVPYIGPNGLPNHDNHDGQVTAAPIRPAMAHTLRTSPESGVLARRATARRPPNSWTLAHGFAAAVRAFAVGTALCAAAPAYAQAHRARLSEDLVDNLAAQSQRIDVIVHGDKAEVDALAARYNLTVKRYLKASAVLQVNAGQLAGFSRTKRSIICRGTRSSGQPLM